MSPKVFFGYPIAVFSVTILLRGLSVCLSVCLSDGILIVPVLLDCAHYTAQRTNPSLCLHERNVLCHVLTAFAIRRCSKKMFKETLFNPNVNFGYI